jgi:hypothetical protein
MPEVKKEYSLTHKRQLFKIEIKKRLGKKYPYYYANKCPKQYGDWRYVRTLYVFRWLIVFKLFENNT